MRGGFDRLRSQGSAGQSGLRSISGGRSAPGPLPTSLILTRMTKGAPASHANASCEDARGRGSADLSRS